MTHRSLVSLLALQIVVHPILTHTASGQIRPAKINVSYASTSAVFLPYWIAKDRDLYKRYGVDAQLIYIAGASKNMQSLMANDIQFAGVGTGAIEANVRGGGTVYVASFVNHFIFSLYGNPRISAIQDLRGAPIGVTRFGTATEYAARFVLSKYGLNPDKDVTILQTGGIPETLAAISSGAIKAGIVSPPLTLRARRLGLKELVNITALKLPFIQSGAVVAQKYISAQPENVMAMTKALVQAISMIKNDKTFAKTVIGKYTHVSDDDLLEETYRALSGEFPRVPYPPSEALKVMLGIINERETNKIREPVEKFVNNTFLKKLEEDGFVNEVYRAGGKQ